MRSGLRERKQHETRIALSWAAIPLAVERGFDKVRVECPQRTFNDCLSGKAEAIATRHIDRAQRIAVELRSRPVSEPLWDALVNAVLAQFTLGQEGSGQNALDEDRGGGHVRAMVPPPGTPSSCALIDKKSQLLVNVRSPW